MLKNPIINALLAALYIAVLVFSIQTIAPPGEDTIFSVMLGLSMLVMSVAIMGVLFFYQPLKLFMENKREEALVFIGKMIGTFAIFVIVLIIIVLM